MTRPPHFWAERLPWSELGQEKRSLDYANKKKLATFSLVILAIHISTFWAHNISLTYIEWLIFLPIIIHCNYLLINNQVPRHKLLVKVRIIHVAAQWEYWEYLFIESAHLLLYSIITPALTTITFESNEPWEKLISWRRAALVSESKAGPDIIPGTCGFLPGQI